MATDGFQASTWLDHAGEACSVSRNEELRTAAQKVLVPPRALRGSRDSRSCTKLPSEQASHRGKAKFPTTLLGRGPLNVQDSTRHGSQGRGEFGHFPAAFLEGPEHRRYTERRLAQGNDVFRFNSLWEEAGPETELPRARGPWVIAGNRPQAAPRRL